MTLNSLRLILFLFSAIQICGLADLQTTSGIEDKNLGPRYSKPRPVYYEFGLKVTANGPSTGIIGTVPIPINWPEQQISFVAENKSANLRKIAYKDLNKNVRQMILKINGLKTGEVAEGSVIVRANKRDIELPVDPSKLQFSSKLPGPVKQYLRPSPYIECNHKVIRELAESMKIDESESAWKQVETIYKWVRENIEYKFDEKIHSCLDAIESGNGDCEELSSIFIAICRAKGIPARAVWIPTHTYPEFYLEDRDDKGYWFPCQAAGMYEFGTMTEAKPILQKGDRFKLPGNPKPMRYVQPTLVAKDSAGGLSIEFISREITDEEKIRELQSIAGEAN